MSSDPWDDESWVVGLDEDVYTADSNPDMPDGRVARVFGTMHRGTMDVDHDQAEERAYLIRAAPEMARLLEDLVEQHQNGEDVDEQVKKARALLDYIREGKWEAREG